MPPVKKHAVSPDICGSRVILFLGAGASAPLGLPLMGSFMKVLEGQMNRKLLQIMQGMFAMPGKSSDLEILFDTLGDYDKIANYCRGDRNWTGMLGRSRGQGVENLIGAAEKIRRLAAKVVLEEYSNVRVAELRNLYEGIVLLFAESSGRRHVPIFTTNYDLAIETLAHASDTEFDLVDGFTRDNVRRWDPSIFYRYRATASSEPTILLFKLHGSCQWRVHMQTEEVTKESTAELVGADSAYDNALMWPAETKSIKKGPYETNYNYLEQCLMQAEACLVIGFSFRDELIKRYFAKAMDLNEKLKVALVDPHAEALAQDLLGGKPTAETLEQDRLGVEPTTTIPGPEETIVVRRSDGTLVHGIPTCFEPDELPHIVKALLRVGFPLDGERAAALFA
jgi:hypothetical protein